MGTFNARQLQQWLDISNCAHGQVINSVIIPIFSLRCLFAFFQCKKLNIFGHLKMSCWVFLSWFTHAKENGYVAQQASQRDQINGYWSLSLAPSSAGVVTHIDTPAITGHAHHIPTARLQCHHVTQTLQSAVKRTTHSACSLLQFLSARGQSSKTGTNANDYFSMCPLRSHHVQCYILWYSQGRMAHVDANEVCLFLLATD